MIKTRIKTDILVAEVAVFLSFVFLRVWLERFLLFEFSENRKETTLTHKQSAKKANQESEEIKAAKRVQARWLCF